MLTVPALFVDGRNFSVVQTDDVLVTGATESEGDIAEALDVRAVDDDIDIRENPLEARRLYLVHRVAGVYPDGLFRHCGLDFLHEGKDVVVGVEGIATRQRQSLDVTFRQFAEEVVVGLLAEGLTTEGIPRLRILTAVAVVRTSCYPEGYAESLTIIHVARGYIVNAHRGCGVRLSAPSWRTT